VLKSPALFRYLVPHFHVTKSNHDYEVAMAPLDKIIASYSPADTPSHYLDFALDFAAGLAKSRFDIFENPDIRKTGKYLIYLFCLF
jgi:hypothetical protein